MKQPDLVRAAVVLVLLGALAPASAQDRPRQDPKPKPKREQPARPKPEAAPQPPRPRQPEARPHDQRPDHRPPPGRPVRRSEHRDTWHRFRARSWESEHRTWRQRGGYTGYRIPAERFRVSFGRGHWFRLHAVPLVLIADQLRFQFGGLWFSLVDPWPEHWADNWYETDDVYIDYDDDGYYLFNRGHAGIRVAVTVFVN